VPGAEAMRYYTYVESPIDPLLLVSDGTALIQLHMRLQRYPQSVEADWKRDDGLFKDTAEQLAAYFAGELHEFDLELNLEGTEFQRRVWAALLEIPFGETRSYKEIAIRIGDLQAIRAVGLANGRNPIGIIVPCHRVIGSNGSLTGYGGGLPRKQWLLQHESAHRRGAHQEDWVLANPTHRPTPYTAR
jgi:methylated-DNA-[protein]-cysteine S-methyltransferase